MNQYTLLPFQFKILNDDFTLLVNQAGEYLRLNTTDFKKLCTTDSIENNEVFNKLRAKHFLAINDEELDLAVDLLATKLRTRKAFIADFTALHMIVVTLRCNCKCKYCHASSVNPEQNKYDMDWETAKNTIDMIFQTPCKVIKIEFQGGEPLLNWSIIKESILYANLLNKLLKKEVEFIICTNLIEITDEQLLFCKKYNVQISTSLDGLKHHHDKNRPTHKGTSSYDSFIDKLNLTRNILGKNSVAALLTITKDNISDLIDIIDHYVELGFEDIFLRALNPYGNAILNSNDLAYTTEEFIESYKNALNYIIQLNIKGIRFVESYATLFLSRILTPFSTGFVDLQSPSGAGISGVIYNYDGNIYPADEGRMLARMGDDYFNMGNVNTSSFKEVFSGNIIRDIAQNSCLEIMPVCSECVYQQYCGADPIRNYLETNDVLGDRLNSDFCKKNKAVMDYLFGLILENDKRVMNVFWSWITRRSYKEVSLEKI